MRSMIQEAVAVFDPPETLEAAVFALETRGFDRATFSVLATEEAVVQKTWPSLRKSGGLRGRSERAAADFLFKDFPARGRIFAAPGRAAMGALTLFGVGGTLPVIISAGAGALIGATLGRLIHQHDITRVKEQLARGGLLLWVSVRDQAEEDKALEILRAHSADDVHIHEIQDLVRHCAAGPGSGAIAQRLIWTHGTFHTNVANPTIPLPTKARRSDLTMGASATRKDSRYRHRPFSRPLLWQQH